MTATWTALSSAIEITSSNNAIRVNDGGEAVVSLTAGTYYITEQGGADDLINHIMGRFNLSLSSTWSWSLQTIDPEASGVPFVARITSTGSTSLMFSHATTTFDPTFIGFPASDTSTGTDHDSTLMPTPLWMPDIYPSRDEPARPRGTVHVHEAPDGSLYSFVASDPVKRRTLAWHWVDGARCLVEHVTADPARSFQDWWSNYARDGRAIRYYRNATKADLLDDASLIDTYKLAPSSADGGLPIPSPRPRAGLERYHVGPLHLVESI